MRGKQFITKYRAYLKLDMILAVVVMKTQYCQNSKMVKTMNFDVLINTLTKKKKKKSRESIGKMVQ